MFPLASLVVLNVIVTVPLPDVSAPTTDGTSFAGNSVVVNVGLTVLGVVELPQPATRRPSVARTDRCFMSNSPLAVQKNLRERLKPRYRLCGFPPLAIW